jgi:DNA-binding NarL/FixJ family response regulator
MITIIVICKETTDQKLITDLLVSHTDFQIVQTGKDGYDALISVAALQPDIIIMDMKMSDIGALDLAPMIKRRSPGTALIVFYSIGEEDLVSRAINAGISGFLLKEADMDKLADLVRIISRSGCYISTPIIYRIFNAVSEMDRLPGSAEEFLAFRHEQERIFREFSPTERRIISLLAQGYFDDEIADNLHISRGTVRNCLCAIRRKTGFQHRTQIVLYALKYGLINRDRTTGLETIDRLALIPYNKQNGGSYANGMRNRSGNPELQADHLRL